MSVAGNPNTSETINPPDSFHWRVASTIVSGVAEFILIVVTLAIIAAMWLPAYLTSTGQHPVNHEPFRDGRIGFTPRL